MPRTRTTHEVEVITSFPAHSGMAMAAWRAIALMDVEVLVAAPRMTSAETRSCAEVNADQLLSAALWRRVDHHSDEAIWSPFSEKWGHIRL